MQGYQRNLLNLLLHAARCQRPVRSLQLSLSVVVTGADIDIFLYRGFVLARREANESFEALLLQLINHTCCETFRFITHLDYFSCSYWYKCALSARLLQDRRIPCLVTHPSHQDRMNGSEPTTSTAGAQRSTGRASVACRRCRRLRKSNCPSHQSWHVRSTYFL